ncbi:transcriptional regulator, y4mF family [Serratia liquefaciens]|nr:transcriptional regulator, y4mF family [Serratia liquefaciens]
MNTIEDNLNQRISARIRIERESRGWSLNDLAERAGASRAMIHKIERGESSRRLDAGPPFRRLRHQYVDPDRPRGNAGGQAAALCQPAGMARPQSHYLRRHVSPRSDLPIDLVQIELPPGSDVPMPAASYALARQLIWLQQGELVFVEGNTRHEMQAGIVWSLARPTIVALLMNPQRPASIWWFALINRHPALNGKARCA